jgi:hypothetical protein
VDRYGRKSRLRIVYRGERILAGKNLLGMKDTLYFEDKPLRKIIISLNIHCILFALKVTTF